MRRFAILRHLHQIGLLHLLKEFYSQTMIPPAVAHELERGRSSGIDLPEIGALSWLKIQTAGVHSRISGAGHLGAGETEVLALGLQFPEALVILDDGLGRLHAKALSLTFTGTLGILLRAKAEGRIPMVKPFIDQLGRLGFRLSPKTYATILNQARE